MTLEVKNVMVELSGRRILRSVSFAVEPGEVVGLLGPNGAGKSTLMRAITGQYPAYGSIRLLCQDLPQLSPKRRARLIAYLPQTRIISWPMSVRDTVALGRLPWRAFGQRMTEADHQAVQDALALMDVAQLAGRKATELSGGEQARVLAARWCDRLILLKDGDIAGCGAPEELMQPERLAEVFGIRAHIAREGDGLVLAPTGLTEAGLRQPGPAPKESDPGRD
jgi:iron complex transport system ATP-binding protein